MTNANYEKFRLLRVGAVQRTATSTWLKLPRPRDWFILSKFTKTLGRFFMRVPTALLIILLLLFSLSPGAPMSVSAAGLTVQTTTGTEDAASIEGSHPVANAPALQSLSACLMDAQTGQILYGKDMDQVMYPASITKIMTALLALENSELTDIITMSHEAVFSVERGSSHIALDVGEQISMNDALYGLAISSANDAANGIAEHVGGTIDQFVKMMNERAAQAGALNTHFANANGLPDPEHVTTARDMALITRAAWQTPGWTTYFSTEHYVIPPTNIQPKERAMYAANSFVNGEETMEGLVASKTGYTNEAHHTLVTVASRNGRTLIAVVMNSELRSAKWDDTIALMDYGFEQFRAVTLDPAIFPSDTVLFTDGQGQARQATLAVQEPVQVWLHQSVKTSDLDLTLLRPSNPAEADLANAAIKITVGSQFSDRMSPEVATIPITPRIELADGQAEAEAKPGHSAADAGPAAIPGWFGAFAMILVTAGLLILAAIIYLVRLREIKRRHRRERLAQLRRNYQDSQTRYH